MRRVKHFKEFGSLYGESNSYFISLLPKVKDPSSLINFRPISLIEYVYNIIAKLVASKIKHIIGSVIHEAQSAFIEGQNILDGLLIINKVYTHAKKSKRKLFLFKVDFDKAFDSINWSYLESVMFQIGFVAMWWFWIKGCLPSYSTSVHINGSTTKEFSIPKGARQGHPL